jgi:hypothetical protein
MSSIGATIDAYFECMEDSLPSLYALADRVDRFVDHEPPPGGYTLSSAVSAIFNGGRAEEIQAALNILSGWTFQPRRPPR